MALCTMLSERWDGKASLCVESWRMQGLVAAENHFVLDGAGQPCVEAPLTQVSMQLPLFQFPSTCCGCPLTNTHQLQPCCPVSCFMQSTVLQSIFHAKT